MDFVSVAIEEGGIAVVAMSQGKVNAINEQLVDELTKTLDTLKNDKNVKCLVLTGRDKFFSFGFDIPGFYDYSREDFTAFTIKFTSLYQALFMYPKPVIASINGHCIAGGAMLACACDYRIMVAGKNKIGINELGFGSTVFAGTVEMLKYCVGRNNARKILYSSQLYSAGDAQKVGLIDKITTSLDIKKETLDVAQEFSRNDSRAFASIKHLLREPVFEVIMKRESHSIHNFVDIWYSEETRKRLKDIKIHS